MHCYILNIEVVGLKVLDDFFCFPHYMFMEDTDPLGPANLDTRAIVGR